MGAILESQPWDRLRPLIRDAGFDESEGLERLKRYAAAVIEWNRNVSNLISGKDEERFVERHLVESLMAAKAVNNYKAINWIDFGSGAGLPALPLAMLGIGKKWRLVESRRVKTLFLEKVVSDLGLSGVEVVRERLENLADRDTYLSSFEGFTARATMAFVPTLELAAKVVKKGGYAFLWKGSRLGEEMLSGDWAANWVLDENIHLSGIAVSVSKLLRK